MAKRTVIDCDHCGTKGVSSPQQIHVQLPQARVVAEDDAIHTETLDLCPVCCTRELQRIISSCTVLERQSWVQRMKQPSRLKKESA